MWHTAARLNRRPSCKPGTATPCRQRPPRSPARAQPHASGRLARRGSSSRTPRQHHQTPRVPNPRPQGLRGPLRPARHERTSLVAVRVSGDCANRNPLPQRASITAPPCWPVAPITVTGPSRRDPVMACPLVMLGYLLTTNRVAPPRGPTRTASLAISSLLRCSERGLVLANERLQRLGHHSANRFDHISNCVELAVLVALGHTRQVLDQPGRHDIDVG